MTGGNIRRKFTKVLYRMVACDQCPYRPLRGSKLEPYLALLVLTMVDSLIPYQLLSLSTFDEYYNKIFSPAVHIRGNLYKASIWKMHAMIHQILFNGIFSARFTTRYQHALSSCGEYWVHHAHKLRSTPRALFGADAGEQYNDQIKKVVISSTTKYARNSDLKQVLLQQHINRYSVREESEHLNTLHKTESIRTKQGVQDAALLRHSDRMRNYFIKHNVLFDSVNDPVVRFIQRRGLYANISIWGEEFCVTSPDTDSDSSQSESSSEDDQYSNFQEQIAEPMDDSEYEIVSKLKFIECIQIVDRRGNQYLTIHAQDDRSYVDIQLKQIALYVHFQLNDPDSDEATYSPLYKITWHIQWLYKYCIFQDSHPDETQDSAIFIFLKFNKPPILMTKRYYIKKKRNRYQTNNQSCAEAQVC